MREHAKFVALADEYKNRLKIAATTPHKELQSTHATQILKNYEKLNRLQTHQLQNKMSSL